LFILYIIANQFNRFIVPKRKEIEPSIFSLALSSSKITNIIINMEKKKSDSKKDSNKKDEKKTTSAKKGKLKIEDENALKDFLIDELKDIYFAEHEIMKGLEKMKEGASSSKLKKAIESHHKQTEKHISRLEEAFELLDQKPAKKKCEAIIGILKEGDDVMEDTDEGTMTRDAAIIIASQKVEHYEIATYGSLAELARTIDRKDVAKLLESTLKEEKKSDVTLTVLAVDKINEQAAQEPSE
jgi:ferritin-like metal-binding protein YciE